MVFLSNVVGMNTLSANIVPYEVGELILKQVSPALPHIQIAIANQLLSVEACQPIGGINSRVDKVPCLFYPVISWGKRAGPRSQGGSTPALANSDQSGAGRVLEPIVRDSRGDQG